jgi:putative DNA primase/helicase
VSGAARAEAATYHRRGWCPIPVKNRSKEPNLPELAPYLNRRATKDELNSWMWSGVGIVTGRLSGILVLDVDGSEGEQELKKHRHPTTPMVRTASGGLHLYFKHPNEEIRTGIRVAPGLDVKASGGYVVAPPSVGPNGKPYEWIISLEDAEPADPPEWLMQLIQKSPRRNGTAGSVGDRIPSGQRNKELTSIAGTMRRRGMGGPEILAALLVANERRCEPPLKDEEVHKIATSVARYEPATLPIGSANGSRGRPTPPCYTRSDLGNAERFIDMHGDKVRWCPARKAWLIYDGMRWDWDECGVAVKFAHETARSIHKDAALETDPAKQKEIAKFAVSSQDAKRISGMLSQARPYLAVSMFELDRDPWIVNCRNGTLDLRTGELKPHRPADLITKLVPVEYDAAATCPRFHQFLKETLVDDAVVSFIKRFAGYTLTGITRERLLAILHGSGKNGKTTLVEVLHSAAGDYATNTDTETILAKRYQGVGNDVAALKGARFVSAAEVEQGRRLAESKVKQLTGSDTVTARYLFGEPFNFKPQFKLWLSTNNKPVIQGTDDAIWDRIRLVPFTQRFEGTRQDPKLLEKLLEELPGIFAWMVEGCLEWQEHGLGEPDSVRDATDKYRSEMDTLAAFIDDKCVVAANASVLAEELYQKYSLWCEHNGERKEAQKGFVPMLSERGFLRKRATSGVNKGRYIWRGIGLRTGGNSPDEGGDGSLGEPNDDDGSPHQSRIDMTNIIGSPRSGEPGEAKNHHLRKDTPREEKDMKNGFTGFTGFTPPGDQGTVSEDFG